MAVFRMSRAEGFTMMARYHLRDKALSLKAKGLLSQMLSLPEDWDYTLAGLAALNREGVDAVRAAVKELEAAGYLRRTCTRTPRGFFSGNLYTIYEKPPAAAPVPTAPERAAPPSEPPTPEEPALEAPPLEKPTKRKRDRTKEENPPYSPPGGGGYDLEPVFTGVGSPLSVENGPPLRCQALQSAQDSGGFPPCGEPFSIGNPATPACEYRPLFLRFWSGYPRKADRKQAMRAWGRLKPDAALWEDMSRGLERWKASSQWQREGGRYIPSPATWLRGRRWEDEDIPQAGDAAEDGPVVETDGVCPW